MTLGGAKTIIHHSSSSFIIIGSRTARALSFPQFFLKMPLPDSYLSKLDIAADVVVIVEPLGVELLIRAELGSWLSSIQ
jgi:hypothetical protein